MFRLVELPCLCTLFCCCWPDDDSRRRQTCSHFMETKTFL